MTADMLARKRKEYSEIYINDILHIVAKLRPILPFLTLQNTGT